MFGLEILDVVIGLTFVYLLLSLFATALNEYIAAVLNLRGKELAKGLGQLLDDLDEKDSLKKAFDGVVSNTIKPTLSTDLLTERFYNHRLVRPLATRRGWLFRRFSKEPRLPSYIPARTFAFALLDVLGVSDDAATLPSAPATTPATAELQRVLAILKREAPHDVNQALGGLKGLLANAGLPPVAKVRLMNTLTGTQTQLQNLHDSVEVWFNNAMDRVSGAYKRTAQGWLFVLGLLIATWMNADTIDMWRRLEANDELRSAMAARAAATLPALDTLAHRPPQDALPPAVARERYQTARARLDEMELKLGWSRANPWPTGFWPGVMKIIGLLLTALAISLGAPFWFDLLNKVISIRAAGRSPEEKPKSPEGGPKRIAERAPK